jgi:hypothetical protein
MANFDQEQTLELVQKWVDGEVEWAELPTEVQKALDVVMAETVSDRQPEKFDAIGELLHKANNEHRFTLGPWYIPNQYDAHGEWTDAEELQKSLWEYVKSGDRGIRLQHNKDIVAGEWLEAMSFPVPVTIGMNKDANAKQVTYPAGTVFLGVQWKPWAWDMVKAGKIRGFSIGGAAARIEMAMPEEMVKSVSSDADRVRKQILVRSRVFEALKAQGFGGNRSEAARYAAQQRWKGHKKAQKPASKRPTTVPPVKPDVVTNDAKEALRALRDGKTVSLESVEEVNTLIDKLHKFAEKSKKKGDKVKLNLCKISVPGTNLFCGEALAGKDGKPIERKEMPQLAGKPVEGSPADDESKYPKDDKGEVNVGDAFVKHLASKGVSTREGKVPAATLKASQSELKGATVAFLMSKEGQAKYGNDDSAIFVSKDGYIIDGHHRWAATVGLDASDGRLGGKSGSKINVRVVDMGIIEVLEAAKVYAKDIGIAPKDA